ncbi:hypothetical protein LCGC14_1256780 [marine sediment metagenome]|uniref:Uncharacterized protein n=1 Tax=marine sediment metagenome TaxID=412755 RepID=A0A0F9LN58_9ZZZZ
MAFTHSAIVTVDAGDRTILIKQETLQWERLLNGRSTAEWTMADEKGAFRPSTGMPVIIEELTQDTPGGPTTLRLRFAGLLTKADEAELGGTLLHWKCKAGSYEQLFDRFYVTRRYERRNLDQIVPDILDTTDISVEGLTYTGVEQGPRWREFVANTITVQQAFTDLTEFSGFSYWIDVPASWPAGTLDLQFRKPTTPPGSPVTLDSANLERPPQAEKPKVNPDLSCYANRVIVVGGDNIHNWVAQKSNNVEIAARAAHEGTAGVHTKRFDRPSVTNRQHLLALAEALLARYSVTLSSKTFVGVTRVPGFEVGQEVVVNLPDQGLANVDMLINRIKTRVRGTGKDWTHEIQAKGPTA